MALINLRNALMTGKRLPYDAEVEYLQSTGIQYIDTGVIPDTQDIRVDITYANGSGHLFGSRVNSSFDGAMWSTYAANVNYCRKDWLASNVSISVAATAKTIVFSSDSTGSSITYNGTTETGGVKTTTNLSMIIFGVNTNGTITAATQMTLYSFKIWKSGILVRDFIPVRKGTVGYLYDRVSGKLFGNDGTGDFVLGPDVVPVEWLESDGSQYVDTGIRVDNTYGFNISFMGLNGNDRIVMGVKGTGDSRWCLSGAFTPNVNLSWNTSSGNPGLGLRKIQEARMNYLNDRKRILNGVDVGNITSSLNASANSYDVCLFAGYWGNANVSLYSAARIYFAQISKGQEIVRSFRPVRVGTEGAMMDVLTRRIYRNAGTGAFTYGNDLKYPIPAE